MTRPRLIFLIRLTTLAVVLWFLGMPLSVIAVFGPVALFMPVFAANPCVGGGCTSGTAPNSVTLTGSGFTTSSCCNDFNASYVIPYLSEVANSPPIIHGQCNYRYSWSLCGSAGGMTSLDFRFINQTTFIQAFVAHEFDISDTAKWVNNSLAAPSIDCSAAISGGVTLSWSFGSWSPCVSGTGVESYVVAP